MFVLTLQNIWRWLILCGIYDTESAPALRYVFRDVIAARCVATSLKQTWMVSKTGTKNILAFLAYNDGCDLFNGR